MGMVEDFIARAKKAQQDSAAMKRPRYGYGLDVPAQMGPVVNEVPSDKYMPPAKPQVQAGSQPMDPAMMARLQEIWGKLPLTWKGQWQGSFDTFRQEVQQYPQLMDSFKGM